MTDCNFLEAYKEADCDFILAKEEMERLYEAGETPSRTFIGKICLEGDLKAIRFLIYHRHHFDKMAIFVSALEGHPNIMQELFAHQSFPDLNVEQLVKSLYNEGLIEMIDVLVLLQVVDQDKVDTIVEAIEDEVESD